MALSNADNPMADRPSEPMQKKPKAKPEPTPASAPEKTGLADAAASPDPYVQKLMFDRGFGGDDTTAVDDELRKLGFDL